MIICAAKKMKRIISSILQYTNENLARYCVLFLFFIVNLLRRNVTKWELHCDWMQWTEKIEFYHFLILHICLFFPLKLWMCMCNNNKYSIRYTYNITIHYISYTNATYYIQKSKFVYVQLQQCYSQPI